MQILNAKKTRTLVSVIILTALMLQLTTFTSGTQACTPVPSDPEVQLDVQADVGAIHFNGEMAEFYILVSLSGNPTNATVKATLYYDGAVFANVTGLIQHVDTGLYRVPYTIPCGAQAGTYALVATASYYTAEGTALTSFLLSPTLKGWNAWLTEIRNNIATIKTDISTIQVSLADLDAAITTIEGDIVTIQTNIGVIQTDINTIGLTLTTIKGDVATITTSIGTIEGNMISIQNNIATIQTDIGSVQVDISNIDATVTNI
jgi:prefoldin subunit 5